MYSKEIKKEVILKYMSGISSEVLSKEYNISNVSILNWVKKEIPADTFAKRKNHRGNTLLGKTYENIHGEEEGKRLKKLRSNQMKGIPKSEETKKRISITVQGRESGFKGKHHKTETREILSKIRREKYKEKQTINKQVRRYWKLEEWRKKVFERDNYTCQKCGIKNKKGLGKTVYIHAHHIKSLSSIIGELSFEKAILVEELYDINNGVTLCIKCHKKEHKRKNKK
jgi:5-methylcytosine-specific restriction endonuclease McrA